MFKKAKWNENNCKQCYKNTQCFGVLYRKEKEKKVAKSILYLFIFLHLLSFFRIEDVKTGKMELLLYVCHWQIGF